ncbi:ABC transporter permease subunit [Streptomyces antarcticus]|uniref:ABC transporter permease subunit n=1 Tax=Streptomyces antarcticus TaxID=2996458 RepID=UPI00227191D8|nr:MULTISPECIES: ABC transporter permease subunit [unclassified Streptomyces]MCY0940466.1 ABC transporter permease subunit [Streptomyces sp. H34-AA3]MCZ4082415.1 ABC transporter permease subunit [Streptomyces sp. H34-S5]
MSTTASRRPVARDGAQASETPPARRIRRLSRPSTPAVLLFLALLLPTASLLADAGWPQALRVDLVPALDSFADWVVDNRESHPVFLYFLLHLSNAATDSVAWVHSLLTSAGWAGVLAVAAALAWYAGGGGRRGGAPATVALGSLAGCGLLGLWEQATETLALMLVSVAAASVLGLLLGLAGGLSDTAQRILRPVLNTMQVLPSFAYLLPLVLIFGIGTPSALITTVIYAAPPMVRMTTLGLRGADPGVLEASRSLGSTGWQRLWTARLPVARPQLLLGLNQTIMMALSMVVIASVVGAGGLGESVYQALKTRDFGQGLTAGLAIVLIAVWLDRTTAAAGARLGSPVGRRSTGFAVAVAAAGLLVGPRLAAGWPEALTVDIAAPLNTAVDWLVGAAYQDVPVLGGTSVWAGNFTSWVLNPLDAGLQALPWWSLLLLAGVIAWLVGTWRGALTAVLALSCTGVLGIWGKSLYTLSQVLVAVALTLLLGFAIGTLAARVQTVERLLRPVFDAMQTLPQFIYLIPVVQLFNAGRVAAITAAAVYALPAVVRVTTQGLQQVNPVTMEVSRSLGATTWQQIRDVQWPLARPALLVAANQGVVLVLAVVVIGGLVGGGALGFDVVKGLTAGELGTGLIAGAGIVCLGLALDKLTQPSSGPSSVLARH